MTSELHVLAATRLRHDGQRYTSSRRGIVEALEAAGQPLTIPEILGNSGELAQSSVYRNLTILETAGVVVKVVTNSEWGRYELAEDLTGHHHHLICSVCGAVRDIIVPPELELSIGALLEQVAATTKFTIDEHRLDLVGRCEECA
jgi:Fur family transcriptional regulator, ferric uptake regulator